MRVRLGVAALLCAAAGCRSTTGVGDDNTVCTAEARPAIAVTVRDSVTGAAVPLAGAVLVARDGAYADTVRTAANFPSGLPAPLAYERAGTYLVRVELPGYRAWERAGVQVTRDVCHVRTAAIAALLQPATR